MNKREKYFCSYSYNEHKHGRSPVFANSHEDAAIQFANALGTLFWRCHEGEISVAVWVWDKYQKNKQCVGLVAPIQWRVEP